jgi:hypothetical protein
VIFHEEHRRNDNIALGDVLKAMLKTVGFTAPFRGGMQRQIETRNVLLQCRARAIDPAHPGADYFLGYAYRQSGEIRAARSVWASLIARSPPDAPWREGLEAEVARLDDMIARAPMLQGQ